MKTVKITLDDIVFENRNKEYGAYYLRTHYNANLFKAMGIGVISLLTILAIMYFRLQSQKKTFAIPNTDKGVWVNIKDFTEQNEVTKPKVIKTKQAIQNIQQKEVLPPVAVSDNTKVAEKSLPDMTQLDDYVIGSKDIEGIPNMNGLGVLITQSESMDDVIEPKQPTIEPEKTFEKAEIDPTFVGGISAMYKYLSSQLNYPKAAQRVNLEGKVFVKFVVEKDGNIAQVEVIKGIGFGCDEEAARVIKGMPKWNPGKQNGKNVRVYYTLPIWFKLE